MIAVLKKVFMPKKKEKKIININGDDYKIEKIQYWTKDINWYKS